MVATLILVAFCVFSLSLNMAKHGEPKTGNYNAGWSFLAVMIQLTLYYYAGALDSLK